MPIERGLLITIEGLDGAGKTTLATALAGALTAQGINVRQLREPGGVHAAERVRDLVKDPTLQVAARTEALLYAAARAQLVEEALEPLLNGGVWVLLDRYIDSSLAYQGAGRGLGIEAVRQINEFATEELRADRTLLLEIDPADGRSRSLERRDPPDRIELEDDGFYARVASAYTKLADEDPRRITRIDAARAPADVLAAALAALQDLL
jgi:dTMP kinase